MQGTRWKRVRVREKRGTYGFRRHSFDQRFPSRDRKRVRDLEGGKRVSFVAGKRGKKERTHRILIFLRQPHSVLLSHILPLLRRTVELVKESLVSLLDLRIVRGGSWVILDGGKRGLGELSHRAGVSGCLGGARMAEREGRRGRERGRS
jgi:hypothetical protein